ncbi:MAG: MarR family transcriptional regulator [Anaeromyxobacter sp.]
MTEHERHLREWVEELAAQLEGDGLPRMGGRIFAWLLVCEPPEQSMEELARALGGSKASMSTMTRLLMGAGFIERVRRPFERRDVFRVPEGQWGRFWQAQMARLHQVTQILARGAGLVASRPAPVRRRVEDTLEQYRFLEGELELLAQRWRDRFLAAELRAAAGAPPGAPRPGATPRRTGKPPARRPRTRPPA